MSRTGTTRAAAMSGAVAAAAGAAAAELVTGLLSLRASPLVAVAETFIEVTPGGLAEFFIGLVGQADKPLLVAGVVLVLLAVGALGGVGEARRRGAGMALLVLLGALGGAAVLSRPRAGWLDAAPAVVGVAVSLGVLGWLLSAAEPAGRSTTGSAVSRRSFLLQAGGAAAGAVVIAGVGRWLSRGRTAVEAARDALRLPLRPVRVPAGVSVGVAGVSPWSTPVDQFYRIDTALVPPLLAPADWRLRVHGLVERELDLSFADLIERELVDAWITLCCVSNPVGGDLIGNTRWTGVRIADLLQEAGVLGPADAVLSRSVDGWTCGTPLAALTDGRDALLAVAMNGEKLPIEHGFPARMVVPGLYGFVSATKWVVDLEVTTFDAFSAYWTERGWAEEAPVKTASRIDVPADGANVDPGTVAIAGVAWAQQRGIEAVEVRVDGGPWQPAALGGVPTIDTWRQWRWDWDAVPGSHELQVRATDTTGTAQTGELTEVIPDGATGWHTVRVQVG